MKEDRRKDEGARKGDQSSERPNVGASADCTGENDDVIDEETATFWCFSQHRPFSLVPDPGEILLETNANQADGDTDYLLWVEQTFNPPAPLMIQVS